MLYSLFGFFEFKILRGRKEVCLIFTNSILKVVWKEMKTAGTCVVANLVEESSSI